MLVCMLAQVLWLPIILSWPQVEWQGAQTVSTRLHINTAHLLLVIKPLQHAAVDVFLTCCHWQVPERTRHRQAFAKVKQVDCVFSRCGRSAGQRTI